MMIKYQFDGIEEILSQLYAIPDIKLVIATSKTEDEFVNEFLPKFSIANYFDAYVTAGDTKNINQNLIQFWQD